MVFAKSSRLLEAQQDPRHILLLCQTNVAVDGVLKTLFLGDSEKHWPLSKTIKHLQ
jgi:hypothetical protein